MKNYDETINAVFNRINEYEIAKKRKRKIVMKTVTSLCCVCLVALLGIGVWQSDFFKTAPPIELDDSTLIGEKDWIDDKDGFNSRELDNSSPQATDNKNNEELNQLQQNTSTPIENEDASPTTDNKISNDNDSKYICYLNQIDGIASAAPLYLDPAKHYTKDWDNKQVADYFGVDLSNLSSKYKYIGNANHTVTYNNSDSLVRDLVCFNYKYSDIEFIVTASRLGVPYDCVYSLDGEKTTSVKSTNGSVDVLFAATIGGNEKQLEPQKLMVADFQYNGVCYRVTAENISVTEFYSIVSTILNK